MGDYTIKKIDDMEGIYGGAFKRARAALGVESFGMQVLDMPPNVDGQYPEHDHSEDRQEEVYMPLAGACEIEIDGDRHRLEPNMMVRVAPGTKRTIRTGEEGCRILALGGCPGEVYEAPEVTKLGSPDPSLQQA
jgi:uncharacterized cupin superfamily protein